MPFNVHQNHYFLRHLVIALKTRLIGSSVIEIFTQSKDELILRFKILSSSNYHDSIFTIKATLSARFSCLSFPEELNRKKRNTTDLFKFLIGKQVSGIDIFQNERAFHMDFDENHSLVFKLFGTRSNILLYRGKDCIEIFQTRMKGDFEKPFQSFNRVLPFDFESFKNLPLIKEYIPTLSGLPLEILEDQGFNDESTKKKWSILENTVHHLENTSQFYIEYFHGRCCLSLLKTGVGTKVFDDPLEALNTFFYKHISEINLKELKQKLTVATNRQVSKTANYISKSTRQLEKIEALSNFKEMGDVIMANLNRINLHIKAVSLLNFYTGKEINIKLNPDLTPQKNAEKYYRKSKNQSKEISTLKNNIRLKRMELIDLQQKLIELEIIDDLKKLQLFSKKKSLITTKQNQESKPYHERKIGGFIILIGKGAKQNDQMLQTSSWKEDLWLHVKDGPGSHVLIKHQAGKTFPEKIIEAAAQLAAFYSKRKNEALCPVIYTPRKFVRKRKGDSPGAVIVEKEKVILVEPMNRQIK